MDKIYKGVTFAASIMVLASGGWGLFMITRTAYKEWNFLK